MFEHGFPSYWSTLKKLIWLVGAGIAGGVREVWKTVTGTLIHITDALASPMRKCEVTLDPIQDLHGQDAPYPAGGGVNLLNADGDTLTAPSSVNQTLIFDHNVYLESGQAYTFSCRQSANAGNVVRNLLTVIKSDATSPLVYETSNLGTAHVHEVTYTPETSGYYRPAFWAFNLENAVVLDQFQVEKGASFTAYHPYSNICPITGWTGCEVYDDPKYGGFINWNQIVKNPDFSDGKNNWQDINVTSTVSDGVATITVTSASGARYLRNNCGGIATVIGHKYFCSYYAKKVSGLVNATIRVGAKDGDVVALTSEWGEISGILTAAGSYAEFNIYITGSSEQDSILQVKTPICCDLTQMFGVGNEPSTVEEFKALFPQDYYAYNAGTETTVSAVNGDPQQHLSITFPDGLINQWDEEWEVGSINNSTGQDSPDTENIRAKNYIPVKPNTSYYFYIGVAGKPLRFYWYASDYSFISTGTTQTESANTAPANAAYLRIRTTASYGDTYNNDISINYPATITDYHPYHETVYGCTIDFVSGLLAVKMASVDLGTLSWTYQSQFGRAYSEIITNVSAPASDNNAANAICSAYPVKRVNGTEADDGKKVGISTSKRVFVFDSSYSSKAEYEEGLSGVQLVYELAEPIEIQLTPQQIATLKGENNVWGSGDLEITYKAQA